MSDQQRDNQLSSDNHSSSVPHSSQDARTLQFHFHGSGSEYFRIWIVNILLSIITLGIYSAWAKVRNKQYFYGNTELDGASFSYLASPLTILKGRLIALAVVIVYSIMTETSPILGLIALGAMLLLTPFFVQRSLMFNARNSAYRHIRFNFTGSFKESVVVFCLLPLAAMAVMGGVGFLASMQQKPFLAAIVILMLFTFGVPYFIYRQKNYFIANSIYGTAEFNFSADLRDFFKLWLKLLGCSLLALLAAGIVMALVGWLFGVSVAALGNDPDDLQQSSTFIPLALSVYVIGAICYLFPWIYYAVRSNNLIYRNTRVQDFQLQADYRLFSYGRLVVINTLLTLLTLGFYRPWAMVNTARYRAKHTHLLARSSLDDFIAGEADQVSALGEEIGDFYDLDFGF